MSNLVTCDFVCHGVPSPFIWRDYINYIEKKYNFDYWKNKGVKIIMLIMIFVYFIGMLYKGIDYFSVGRYNPFIPYQFCF